MYDIMHYDDEYKIVGILGQPRAGKTLLAVHYLYNYHLLGRPVYTNIDMSFRTGAITVDMLYKFPDELNNSCILFDEIHKYADAYKFFSKSAQAMSTLFTQLGKRKIYLFFTTQLWRTVPIRLRELTTTLIMVDKIKIIDRLTGKYVKGLAKCRAYQRDGNSFVKLGDFNFDGRRYLDMYDTNEIVLGVDAEPAADTS